MNNRERQSEDSTSAARMAQQPARSKYASAIAPSPTMRQARSVRVPPVLGSPAGALMIQRLKGNRAVSQMLAVQQDSEAQSLRELSGSEIHSAAAEGIRTPATTLPFLDRIQASFGRHSIGHVKAHVGPEAAQASRAINALAFASGDHVVFGGTPDLRTVAHEAAHIVQQQAGVQLAGGIGREGDIYERHADAIADAVVEGRAAEGLLAPFAALPASAPTELSLIENVKAPLAFTEAGGRTRVVQKEGGGRGKNRASTPEDPPLRRSGRPRRPRLREWLSEVESDIRGVDYIPHRLEQAGSAEVVADLGPESHSPRANDADSDLPEAINWARHKYKNLTFIAGHMLNCNLGGNGKIRENLTILTSSANGKMKELDNPLKDAVDRLKIFYEMFHSRADDGFNKLRMRIYVTIAVGGGTWGDAFPDLCITRNVAMAASLEGRPTKSFWRETCTAEVKHKGDDRDLDEIRGRKGRKESGRKGREEEMSKSRDESKDRERQEEKDGRVVADLETEVSKIETLVERANGIFENTPPA